MSDCGCSWGCRHCFARVSPLVGWREKSGGNRASLGAASSPEATADPSTPLRFAHDDRPCWVGPLGWWNQVPKGEGQPLRVMNQLSAEAGPLGERKTLKNQQVGTVELSCICLHFRLIFAIEDKMDHDQLTSEVRCPVHGFIGLTDLEREIVDHKAFQRLRRIKQLAWTDYVYPGTSHTRFEHSLGVMHLASRLYEAVVRTSEDTLKEVFKYTDAGLARDWQIVRLAALLHDVGHAPFSHAAEHLLPMKAPENYVLFPGTEKPGQQFTHEDYSVEIIERVLKDLIEQHPCNRRNYKITVDEITALISKRASGGVSLFWKDIISGQLDADRMDYLLRDSLHAGVSYGKFDLDRIVSSVCAVRRPLEESAEPKIAIMKGGIYAAEALIVARYWMHKQVYFHKTRLACDHHLEKALWQILSSEAGRQTEKIYFPRPDSTEELEKFLEWDDYRVMGLLVAGKGGEHGERLMTRNHFRLVCELEESEGTTPTDLGASIKRNDAIVAALGSVVKFVAKPNALWYKTNPANELVLVDNDGKSPIGMLSDHSALMKSINIGYLRFVYVDKSDAAAARQSFRAFVEQQSRSVVAPAAEVSAPEAVPTTTAPPATADSGGGIVQFTLEPTPSEGKIVQRESAGKKGIKDVV